MKPRPRWYQDGSYGASTMRIIVMMGACVGGFMCISGVLAMFMSLDSSHVAMSVGAGLFSIGELTKAAQAFAEARKPVPIVDDTEDGTTDNDTPRRGRRP
jgi:hypothetical protein